MPIDFLKKLMPSKSDSVVCDPEKLRTGVKEVYSAAAREPLGKHPFPVGRKFAESIGYPKHLLDSMPAIAWDAFVGVSNVSIFADIKLGTTILDIGCGSGLDTIIAAKRGGKDCKVIGIDFSSDMLERAKKAVEEVGLNHQIEFYNASAELLPLDDVSVDIILVNGIFNLNPKRQEVFSEIARVLKSGGKVYSAEMVFIEPVETKKTCSLDDWFAWISGAKESGAFLDEFKAVGFSDVQILRTSKNARTNHKKLVAADVVAVKWIIALAISTWKESLELKIYRNNLQFLTRI